MNLDYFRLHIKEELKKEGLTLYTLSQKADLSEDTLRSLIYGKSQDVKLSTISKIADVLHCSVDYLIGRNSWFYDENTLKRIQELSPRSLLTLQALIKIELKSTQEKSENNKDIITVLIPTGNIKDGTYYDNANFTTHDISSYPDSLKKIINLGLLITTDSYEPQYYNNDILLLSTVKKPEYGDVVVYQNNDGQIFIRRFVQSGLEPIDKFGIKILPSEQHLFSPIGVIIKVTKEFDIEQYR